jgi:hypothetical protein
MIHIRRLPLPVPLADQLTLLTNALIEQGVQARQMARDLWNRNRLPRRGLRDVAQRDGSGLSTLHVLR